jgi:hypothetical protein
MSGKVLVATDVSDTVSPGAIVPREGFTGPRLDLNHWHSLLLTLSNNDTNLSESGHAVGDRTVVEVDKPATASSRRVHRRSASHGGEKARQDAEIANANPVSGKRIEGEFGEIRHGLLKRGPKERHEFMSQLLGLWDDFCHDHPIDTSKAEGSRIRQPYEPK